MTDSRRRLLCRSAFVVLCVVPTLIVAMGVAWPSGTAQWETRLSQSLGFDVSIDNVSSNGPTTKTLRQVEISDRELGTIACAAAIEMTDGHSDQSVVIPQLEIEMAHTRHLLSVIHDHVLRRWRDTDSSLTLRCGELTLHWPSNTSNAATSPLILSNVICRVEPRSESVIATLSFYLPAPASQRCELEIERMHRDGLPLATRWRFNTNANSVPCWMLVSSLPQLAHLGADCEFRGAVWYEQLGDNWQADINGRLSKVDLHRLVQQQFAHTLEGTADVELTRAKFRDARLIEAAGEITCTGGRIGTSLLSSAADALKLRLTNSDDKAAVRFSHLAVGFEVTGELLTISGLCPLVRRCLVLDASGEPILREISRSPVPTVALARMLVPDSELQVPLTAETARILSVFPLPSVASQPTSTTPQRE